EQRLASGLLFFGGALLFTIRSARGEDQRAGQSQRQCQYSEHVTFQYVLLFVYQARPAPAIWPPPGHLDRLKNRTPRHQAGHHYGRCSRRQNVDNFFLAKASCPLPCRRRLGDQLTFGALPDSKLAEGGDTRTESRYGRARGAGFSTA